MSEAKHDIPSAMLDAAAKAVCASTGRSTEVTGVVTMAERIAGLEAELAKHQESSFHPDWSLMQSTRESLREARARIAELEEQLAAHQHADPLAWERVVAAMGEDGNEDGGVADRACRLIERQRVRIAELEKQLAADTLIARLSEDDEQWQQFERAFLERFADEPNIVRECLLATAEVKAEIWQSINQARGGASK